MRRMLGPWHVDVRREVRAYGLRASCVAEWLRMVRRHVLRGELN